MTISKTTIRLMHQNYQFLFGKVLPNSVLSINKSHACALEYGHNICIFANVPFVIHIRTIFARQQFYIVICGLINQFMHINQFTLWSQSMKCLSGLHPQFTCWRPLVQVLAGGAYRFGAEARFHIWWWILISNKGEITHLVVDMDLV